jgi:hypothetical protein
MEAAASWNRFHETAGISGGAAATWQTPPPFSLITINYTRFIVNSFFAECPIFVIFPVSKANNKRYSQR